MKRVLILGIGGQDGSYLADVLLEKDYEVHGLYRRSSVNNLQRIEHIKDQIILHEGDLSEFSTILNAIITSKPDEIYNEADQDNVGSSFATPGYSYDITGAGVGRVLQACHLYNLHSKKVKLFQPVSATMFGDSPSPQNEQTPFNPQSPYACAKVFAYYLCRYYRETHNLFVSTGIMFNHDSPRREGNYLLQTICKQAQNVARGKQDAIVLNNLDLEVDIGYAKEYMNTAYQIMQLDASDDFVIGTGVGCSVHKLAYTALRQLNVAERTNKVQKREGTLKGRPEKQSALIADTSKLQSIISPTEIPKCHGPALMNIITSASVHGEN